MLNNQITQAMCDKKLEGIEKFLTEKGFLVKSKAVTSTWQQVWVKCLSNYFDKRQEGSSPAEQWFRLTQLECYMPPEYKKVVASNI
jgi:hypothetical protein